MPKPLTVWTTTNWKILKEMGIPDHLTCLLRNLSLGQEANLRIGHGTTHWFQIRNGIHQGCILSPCLFNFYAVPQSCLILCDPMNRNMPGLPVHHQLPEFTKPHVHWVDDAIQPSHPLSSPSSPGFNLSHQVFKFKNVFACHYIFLIYFFNILFSVYMSYLFGYI